jgi:hypothetical protein
MFSTLSNEPLGRIVLANIQCAYDHDHIDRELLIAFLKAWRDKYQNHDQPLILAKQIINLIPYIADIDTKYRFRHKAKPIMPNKVSTIISGKELEVLIAQEKLNATSISVEGDQFDDHYSERVENLSPKNSKYPHNGIKENVYRDPERNGGQFWITPSDWIENLRRSKPVCFADQVRNLLGLVHQNNNVHLFELCFDAAEIPSSNKATPTFIEATDHRRFKACKQPAKNSGWGVTAHLHPPYKAGIKTGKPELLAKQVPMTKSHWQLKAIGLTTKPAENVGSEDDIDNEFAEALNLRPDFVTWLNENI